MQARDYPFFDARFLAFAHRGGALHPANVGRENTLHAFGTAIDLGYRHLETDVHATADGVLTAFHDERLDRVTDGTGLISDHTWAELSRVTVGEHDRIPRLVDVLVSFPEAQFNIDVKSDAAVDLLADTIEHLNVHERVCVSSFSRPRLLRLRRKVGRRVASAMTSLGVGWTRFSPLATVIAARGQALQIPVRRRIAGRMVTLVTERLISRAHAHGKQVHVWTVDEEDEMERLLDLGVDGIFTDRPALLRTVLLRRGLWD